MLDVQSIIADGVVDASEVQSMRTDLYADGVIDKEEMDALFAINDAVSGNDNDPGWDELFVEAVTDGVLADDETPGVVDADEAAYLIEKIGADGQVDGVEKALLQNILDKAESVDQTLVDFAAQSGITKSA